MLKFAMVSMLLAAATACGGDDGSSGDDPHAVGGCGSDVAPTAPTGAGCEMACQHVPTYTGGSCHFAMGNGSCDQTFMLDTGETGCCVGDITSNVIRFAECE
jgi:hypothetical protein